MIWPSPLIIFADCPTCRREYLSLVQDQDAAADHFHFGQDVRGDEHSVRAGRGSLINWRTERI